MTEETKTRKKIVRKPVTYAVVEVHRVPSLIDETTGKECNPDAEDIDSMTHVELPFGVEATSRDGLMRGLLKAIRDGDKSFDGKELLIVQYTEPFTIKVENTRSVKIA